MSAIRSQDCVGCSNGRLQAAISIRQISQQSGGNASDTARARRGGRVPGLQRDAKACGCCRHLIDRIGWGSGSARAVAKGLALAFVEIFDDRFVTGVSHPKEFRKLPTLTWATKPAGPRC